MTTRKLSPWQAAAFLCLAFVTLRPPTMQAAEPLPGMVLVPAGEFMMGAAASAVVQGSLCGVGDPGGDARPAHRVRLRAFWMDRTEVTNAQFAAFVAATGYVTVAEQPLKAEDFPGVPASALVPGGIVFTATAEEVPLDDYSRWWRYQPGANWRHPAGPGSDVVGKESYPVVQVAYADAVAYARWAGKRLPTEAEWEYAARGGLAEKRYSWGDELTPGNRWMANIYQGDFPTRDSGADGFVGLAPVGQFPANGYGLHDMTGNAWEWCADWYRADYYETLAKAGRVAIDPIGPADSLDPAEPGVAKRVQRGGSFLCTDRYCSRYLVGSRGSGEPDSAANHLGFRCVRDVAP